MPSNLTVINAAQVIVRRKNDGNYLLLRSSEWPERPDRSLKHDLPGGKVDQGETFEQGVCRELKEETSIGIESTTLKPVYALTYFSHHEQASINRLIFFAEIVDTPITLSWEHSEYEWLSVEELLKVDDIRPPYPEIFRYLYDVGVLK